MCKLRRPFWTVISASVKMHNELNSDPISLLEIYPAEIFVPVHKDLHVFTAPLFVTKGGDGERRKGEGWG